MPRLLALRERASVTMGIVADLAQARTRVTSPAIGSVAPPADWTTLAGERLPAAAADLQVRIISSGQPHGALPLTAALALAVAVAVAAREAGTGAAAVAVAVAAAVAAAEAATEAATEAARIDGTMVNRVAPPAVEPLRIGMPSGVLTVAAEVGRGAVGCRARRASFYRAARRLFEGFVRL